MRHRARVLGTWFAVCSVAAAPLFAAKPIERFTAFAVDMSNISPGARTGTVDIAIERWSTDEEVARLSAALKEGGSDALLRQLQKIDKPAGHVSSPGSIGYPLRFARQVAMSDGGRRVIIATDRPVSFLEARSSSRTLDYPFMLIELRLDAKGEGQGKLLPLARVRADSDHVVEIENYASEPVRLTRVKRVS